MGIKLSEATPEVKLFLKDIMQPSFEGRQPRQLPVYLVILGGGGGESIILPPAKLYHSAPLMMPLVR